MLAIISEGWKFSLKGVLHKSPFPVPISHIKTSTLALICNYSYITNMTKNGSAKQIPCFTSILAVMSLTLMPMQQALWIE